MRWRASPRLVAYPEFGVLAGAAGRRSLVLDCEIVALSGPRPDLTKLQRMTVGQPGSGLLATVPASLIIMLARTARIFESEFDSLITGGVAV